MNIHELNKKRLDAYAELAKRVYDILENVDVNEPDSVLAARGRALAHIDGAKRADLTMLQDNLFRVKRESPLPVNRLIWAFKIDNGGPDLEDRLTRIEQIVQSNFEDVALTISEGNFGVWYGTMTSKSNLNRIGLAGDHFENLMRQEKFHAYQAEASL